MAVMIIVSSVHVSEHGSCASFLWGCFCFHDFASLFHSMPVFEIVRSNPFLCQDQNQNCLAQCMLNNMSWNRHNLEKRLASYRDPKPLNSETPNKNSEITSWDPTSNSLKEAHTRTRIFAIFNFLEGIC